MERLQLRAEGRHRPHRRGGPVPAPRLRVGAAGCAVPRESTWPRPVVRRPAHPLQPPARPPVTPPDGRARDDQTFVLDTSVLLSDPRAMLRFDEHEVVLPVVVVTELEAKRHHPELGYFARQALRLLDDLRISEGRLDAPVPVGDDGGTLRVELNHTDPRVAAGRLPARRQRHAASSPSPRTSPPRAATSPW